MHYRGKKEKVVEVLPEGREETSRGAHDWNWTLFLCLLVYRVLSALTCRTAFVPDEHWQSLEVAHRLVFGSGYLTWEWDSGIRGYTHPLLFAGFYKLLQLFNVDYPCAVAEGPKFLQAALTAVSDVYVHRLAVHLFGSRIAIHALVCQLLSWFTFYCAPRTLSNSIEAAATPIVLYHWFLGVAGNSRSTWLYLFVAAFSVLVRPTGAIIWAPLGILHVIWGRERWSSLKKITLIGCVAIAWSVGVDRYCYGKWILVQYNFLQFNVLQGQSALFGVHPWHWYITQGAPAVLFSLTPLTIHGYMMMGTSHRLLDKIPFWLCVWLIAVHSFLSHKEFRFIFPVLPIAALYAGKSVMKLASSGMLVKQLVVAALLVANVPMAMYFSLVHQRGTIAVMSYLRQDVQPNSSVLFLLPCHSTPLHSHMHVHEGSVTSEFLECPPKSLRSSNKMTTEELFFDQPHHWLSARYDNQRRPVPTHLVMFDILLPEVQEFVTNHSYSEVVKLFHTHFLDNEHIGHYILLFHR